MLTDSPFLQRNKAVVKWGGLARFLGTLWREREKFVLLVKKYDRKKLFSTSPFKEHAMCLSRPYALKFMEWLEKEMEPITVSSVSRKLQSLKQEMQIRHHVFCKENTLIHPSQSMLHAH